MREASLRDYKGEKVLVWPSYIDSRRSRGKGRKVPIGLAVKAPKIEEIVRVAENLGLNPEVLELKYPKSWWSETRCVLVDKVDSKLETLKLIAREVKKFRGEA